MFSNVKEKKIEVGDRTYNIQAIKKGENIAKRIKQVQNYYKKN